ncbi:3-oxoacyl-ACP reductase [Actinoplanes sp. NBRC 14428]|uniref:3-oxoacyl-[acyl-carrier protein] reductase n=1 Tax=Pseudosporangium ferrugineum TaxID=439699 RepID=A0A2T0S212_9ACTN|nr:SDR family oxidoreductase [Pseudosporangium ferrugineum]PRY27455.1 3-oxoacyl-[acyl-carrier protein] reductase [Pseudosporangium ferrugineum]BCJ55786.1 3-oxoacyl-ACP reductase [Actinoplanes sp. NBRC 14428]
MTILGSALVTGASRGLGARIAQRLAGDGWPVAVNYHSDRAGAERVVDAIVAAGGRAAAFRADVTSEDEVPGLVAAAEAELGPVQVLVANATGPQPLVPAADVSWQDHLDQLVFFVKSPALLMRATLPGMRALGTGRIVHIGSDSFERALPGASAYNAAKGAQIGLARTWARELGAYGITVNVVAPGWIPVERHGVVTTEDSAGYVRDVPLGRLGTPDDVADVVAFVASDAARFMTGERLTVNGGHTID